MEFFMKFESHVLEYLTISIIIFGPFHRYSTTIRGPRSAERSVDGGSLATSIFACLYTRSYINNAYHRWRHIFAIKNIASTLVNAF